MKNNNRIIYTTHNSTSYSYGSLWLLLTVECTPVDVYNRNAVLETHWMGLLFDIPPIWYLDRLFVFFIWEHKGAGTRFYSSSLIPHKRQHSINIANYLEVFFFHNNMCWRYIRKIHPFHFFSCIRLHCVNYYSLLTLDCAALQYLLWQPMSILVCFL